MPARDMLVVLLRVIGLYLVVSNLAQIPVYAASGFNALFLTDRPLPTDLFVVEMAGLVRPFLLFGFGAILVVIAPRIALRCYPAAETPEPAELALGSSALLRAGLRALGVLLLAWAIEPLISVAIVMFSTGEHETIVDQVKAGTPFIDSLAAVVAYCVLGGILLTRGDAITDWLEQRTARPPSSAGSDRP